MNELEDVKQAAEVYLKKQIHSFSLTLLNSNKMSEFRDWFNKHPYIARLKGIPQSLA